MNIDILRFFMGIKVKIEELINFNIKFLFIRKF